MDNKTKNSGIVRPQHECEICTLKIKKKVTIDHHQKQRQGETSVSVF